MEHGGWADDVAGRGCCAATTRATAAASTRTARSPPERMGTLQGERWHFAHRSIEEGLRKAIQYGRLAVAATPTTAGAPRVTMRAVRVMVLEFGRRMAAPARLPRRHARLHRGDVPAVRAVLRAGDAVGAPSAAMSRPACCRARARGPPPSAGACESAATSPRLPLGRGGGGAGEFSCCTARRARSTENLSPADAVQAGYLLDRGGGAAPARGRTRPSRRCCARHRASPSGDGARAQPAVPRAGRAGLWTCCGGSRRRRSTSGAPTCPDRPRHVDGVGARPAARDPKLLTCHNLSWHLYESRARLASGPRAWALRAEAARYKAHVLRELPRFATRDRRLDDRARRAHRDRPDPHGVHPQRSRHRGDHRPRRSPPTARRACCSPAR